jgi:thymidylate synthase
MGEKNYNSAVEDMVAFSGGLSEYYYSYKIPERSISLIWNQRSVDTFLGLPFNIASYGLLLIILGKLVNMVPDELIGNLGDTHLYSNHVDQAKEQMGRTPNFLPELTISNNVFDTKQSLDDMIKSLSPTDFSLENYKPLSAIKAPLSN